MPTLSKAQIPSKDVVEELKGYARTLAKYIGVPYNVIEGIIWTESKFDPTSYRYSQENHMDRSYGLMHIQWDDVPTTRIIKRGQIVTTNHPTDTGHELARQLGFNTDVMNAQWLYDPIMNLYLGINLVKQLYNSYKDWTAVMNAYNTGNPADESSGYAIKVLNKAPREMRAYGI